MSNATKARHQTQTRAEQPRETAALALVPEGVLGTHRTSRGIEHALRLAQESCILVSPTTTAAAVPEGVAVMFSGLLVDVAAETYKVAGNDDDGGGGNRGLSGPVLFKIAGAAGVKWDPDRSGRVDDGSDPFYCRWRAVGYVQNFDGSLEPFVGEKEVDMRPGSPQIEQLVAQSAGKIRRELRRDRKSLPDAEIMRRARERAEGQVRAIRLHIQSHAETKAQLRAIRKRFGLRSSYTPEELRTKPIVAVRPVYTGESADPEQRRENQAAIRDAFLGGTQALFGRAPALPAPVAAAPARSAPPPVGHRVDDDSGEWIIDGDIVDEPPPDARPAAPPPRQAAQPAPQAQNTPQDASRAPAEADQDARAAFRFRFGKNKNKTLADATMRDLEWYAGVVREGIANPEKAQYREANERDLAIVQAEIEEREREAAQDGDAA